MTCPKQKDLEKQFKEEADEILKAFNNGDVDSTDMKALITFCIVRGYSIALDHFEQASKELL